MLPINNTRSTGRIADTNDEIKSEADNHQASDPLIPASVFDFSSFIAAINFAATETLTASNSPCFEFTFKDDIEETLTLPLDLDVADEPTETHSDEEITHPSFLITDEHSEMQTHFEGISFGAALFESPFFPQARFDLPETSLFPQSREESRPALREHKQLIEQKNDLPPLSHSPALFAPTPRSASAARLGRRPSDTNPNAETRQGRERRQRIEPNTDSAGEIQAESPWSFGHR